MGFGLLLCGYFALTMMSVGMGDYHFAAYLLGGTVCCSAAYKLKAYNPRFVLTLGVSVAYVLLGIYKGLSFLDSSFLWGFMPMGDVVSLVEQSVTLVLNLALHAVMLWAIMELTAHLDMSQLKSRATRNLIAVIVYGVAEAVVIMFPAVAQLENQAIPRLLLLYLLVCYIINAWLLLSCYQLICPAGEENGRPTKRSRFAFINKLNEKFDEKSEKAMRENIDYAAERALERERRKKKREKKKKKKS